MPRVLLLMLAAMSADAVAQRVLPTDIDLRAAYCIRVLHYKAQLYQAAVNGVQDDIAKLGPLGDQADARRVEGLKGQLTEGERKLRETQTGLDRVTAYVTPKLAYLDPALIVAAFARADADISALEAKSCSADCLKGPACPKRECGGQDIAARFKPCERVTWLPSY